MPTQQEMIDGFQRFSAVKLDAVPSGYFKVFGPHSEQHFFIIEKNGSLSVANDITVRQFRGHLSARRGNVGRFTEGLRCNTVDAVYRQSLKPLVAAVVDALKAKPGAW